jgi:5-methylcytosine-specific restriction endonuclease McrA
MSKRINPKAYAKLREHILERDGGNKDIGGNCCLCGRNRSFDVHHVIYRSHGGGDVEENLVTLCRRCHDKAHGKVRSITAQEVRIKLQDYLDRIYNE